MLRMWPPTLMSRRAQSKDNLGELQRDRDTVPIYPAFFAALSLLLDLDGLFHRGANLAIWTLNVVSAVGDLSWLFATSSVATSSCQAMTDKATAGALWAFGRASGTDRPTQCQVVATVIRCGLQRPVHPVPRRELAYVTRRAMFNWKARCGVAGFRGCSEEVQGGFSQTV